MKEIDKLLEEQDKSRKFLKLYSENHKIDKIYVERHLTQGNDIEDLARSVNISNKITHFSYRLEYNAQYYSAHRNQKNTLNQRLDSNTNIKYLDLSEDSQSRDSNNNTTKYVPGMLKYNHKLVHLDLSNNKLGYQLAEFLSKGLKGNKEISYLDLSYNNIGGSYINKITLPLQYGNNLKYLNLYQNNLTTTGANYLAEALKDNSTLEYLNLGYNNFNQGGIKTIASSLKGNKTLTHLDLSNNAMQLEGAKSLSFLLKEKQLPLEHLNISSNSINGDGFKFILSALMKSKYIKYLDISTNSFPSCNNPEIGAKSLDNFIKLNKSIEYLNLHQAGISQKILKTICKSIGSNSNIKDLNLQSNGLGPGGITSLSDAILLNNTIIKLDLSNSNMGSAGLVRLTKSLLSNKGSSITHLNLSTNITGDKPEGADAIANLLKSSNLKYLNLYNNGFNATHAKTIAEGLKANKDLVYLNLGQNTQLYAQGAKHIVEALKDNHSLLELNMYYCQINPMKDVFEALNHNQSLVKIILNSNTYYSSNHSPYFKPMLDFFKNNASVVDVHLTNIGGNQQPITKYINSDNTTLVKMQGINSYYGNIVGTLIKNKNSFIKNLENIVKSKTLKLKSKDMLALVKQLQYGNKLIEKSSEELIDSKNILKLDQGPKFFFKKISKIFEDFHRNVTKSDSSSSSLSVNEIIKKYYAKDPYSAELVHLGFLGDGSNMNLDILEDF
jgi:Ran GTPase-activating protein (RanGAP) involved in mRNA processing and transport